MRLTSAHVDMWRGTACAACPEGQASFRDAHRAFVGGAEPALFGRERLLPTRCVSYFPFLGTRSS